MVVGGGYLPRGGDQRRQRAGISYLEPRWTLKTTYYWQQTFPAHRVVVIDHRYLPSVGGGIPLTASYLLGHSIDQTKGICIDRDFLNAMVTPSADRSWEQHFLEYILVTGANWSGPIRKFRLVVDKGSPDNLVSFCGRGVRKISPTQFEMSVSDFIPTSNLSVLFLTPARPEPAQVQSPPQPQAEPEVPYLCPRNPYPITQTCFTYGDGTRPGYVR